MRTTTTRTAGILVLAVMALLAGCAPVVGSQKHNGPVDTDRFEDEIRQTVAACRENARALDNLYDRLHNAAVDEAGRSTTDLQLSYIQKTYLYVHQARIVAAYQIRLMSDFPYIHEDRLTDFLTLRARDLDQAISEMEDASGFLKVYAAFIRNPRVLADIHTAREMIGGTIYLYENLLETIRPAVNPAAPFTRDPYSPFSRGAQGS